MVDWFLAEKIAAYVAGTAPAGTPADDLEALAEDAEQRVVAYTGMHPVHPLPPPEGIGRVEWVQANLGSMRKLMDPVLTKVGSGSGPLKPAVRLVAGAVATAEVGVIVGFMAQRVLGQYELVMLEEASDATDPRLLFVLPNLSGAVGALDVDEHEFLRWVTLHEVTHAVQFGSVPWLRGHLAGMMKELLAGMEVRIDAARAAKLPSLDDLKRVVDTVRRGDLLGLVARPEERALIERLNAVMAVVEGHAEHVMDACGAEVLPSLPKLRAALDQRRKSASAPAKLLQRLLGLEMKLRQYEDGKRFCDAVVELGGPAALTRVWERPEALPSPTELSNPAAWLHRMDASAAA